MNICAFGPQTTSFQIQYFSKNLVEVENVAVTERYHYRKLDSLGIQRF